MNAMLIIDIVVLLFGLFLAYIAWQMKRTGEINSMVVAKEELPKCKDKPGYIAYVSPRILIFAVAVSIVGILGILGSTVLKVPYLNYIILAVFLVAFGIYTVQMRTAREQFFR